MYMSTLCVCVCVCVFVCVSTFELHFPHRHDGSPRLLCHHSVYVCVWSGDLSVDDRALDFPCSAKRPYQPANTTQPAAGDGQRSVAPHNTAAFHSSVILFLLTCK